MREGAAGYLLKEDLDCLPLARALRTAFERQQAVLARQEMPGTDELTGLTSRAGFFFLGGAAIALWPDAREQRRLAVRYGRSEALARA